MVPQNDFEIIADQARLDRVVQEISRETRIGMDIESNGFFRYPERICLIQIVAGGRVYVIDPLAIGNLTTLGAVLANENMEVVLHSGDHDIRSLDRDWGLRIRTLFDTSLAAAFMGMERLGLATVLQEVLDVTITKDKHIQRSDWTSRPLNTKMLEYAISDVRHLLPLRDALRKRIDTLGRTAWVAEECARLTNVRHEPPDPEMAVFGVKGSHKLDGRGLAILKSLLEYRERHALRLGRPHFRVIANTVLLTLAANPDCELRDVRGLGPFAHESLGSGLRKAIKRGTAIPPLRRPSRPSRPDLSRAERTAADERLARLKAWRLEQGKRLSLDPALLWPMSSLQRLSLLPRDVGAEMLAPEIRLWQRKEFQESLLQVLA